MQKSLHFSHSILSCDNTKKNISYIYWKLSNQAQLSKLFMITKKTVLIERDAYVQNTNLVRGKLFQVGVSLSYFRREKRVALCLRAVHKKAFNTKEAFLRLKV